MQVHLYGQQLLKLLDKNGNEQGLTFSVTISSIKIYPLVLQETCGRTDMTGHICVCMYIRQGGHNSK